MNKNIIDIDTIEDIKNIYDLNSYINNLEIIEKLNDEKDELINNLKEENIDRKSVV